MVTRPYGIRPTKTDKCQFVAFISQINWSSSAILYALANTQEHLEPQWHLNLQLLRLLCGESSVSLHSKSAEVPHDPLADRNKYGSWHLLATTDTLIDDKSLFTIPKSNLAGDFPSTQVLSSPSKTLKTSSWGDIWPHMLQDAEDEVKAEVR